MGVDYRLITLGILAFAMMQVSCAPPSVDPAPGNVTPQQGPPPRIDLPPMIKLEGSLPPETNQDHTMRVDGLLARRDKHLKQKIMVKGFVVETYTCPKKAKRCQPPHFYIADTMGEAQKKLMVVSLPEKEVKRLKSDREYLITGVFRKQSDEGFVRSEGLLVQEKVEEPVSPDKEKKNKGRKRR